MAFFDWLFSPEGDEEKQPDIRFGRYSDSYKEKKNYQAWDDSLEHFENGEFSVGTNTFINQVMQIMLRMENSV